MWKYLKWADSKDSFASAGWLRDNRWCCGGVMFDARDEEIV
jgi:hypothetical protein